MNRGSGQLKVNYLQENARFNEAPIHESGKFRPVIGHFPSGPGASMRPRFMNRGSVLGSCRVPAGVPGFNEAPIHESGKSLW